MTPTRDHGVLELGGVAFHHPAAFWFGVAAVTAGVVMHMPMYLMGSNIGYRLVGMPIDLPMKIGMVTIVAGLAASLYGLYPRSMPKSGVASQLQIKVFDDVPLNAAHVGLLVVMAVAVTIDIMKPTALAFVVPGMTAEYGLKSPLNPSGTVPAAYVALAGITGTVLGSFVWGWLGDAIGRRASILFAGITFIATSICGTMPAYNWNLVMCFLMGMGVGGMVPIAYALLAESIPARHRGWLMVLIGADIAGAYILTSWLAVVLIPIYSWRIMWLIGLPTGVGFIMLNRWIPESPRFLIANGRYDEAHAVMRRYGAETVENTEPPAAVEPVANNQWRQLVNRQFLGITLVITSLAVGSGLILFGFNLWIPSNLRKLGFAEADAILRNAAIIGFPLNFLVAWMYGFWSSKKTIIVLAAVTALSLFGFVLAGDAIVRNPILLYALLIPPIWGISSVVAVLSVYSSEVYPTRFRSRGSGFAAGATKAAGVLIIALVALDITAPSIAQVSLLGAIPMALSVFAMAFYGIETRHRRLEDITADQLEASAASQDAGPPGWGR